MPASAAPYERFTKDELIVIMSEQTSAVVMDASDRIDGLIRIAAAGGKYFTLMPLRDINLSADRIQLIMDGYTLRGFTATKDTQHITISWS